MPVMEEPSSTTTCSAAATTATVNGQPETEAAITVEDGEEEEEEDKDGEKVGEVEQNKVSEAKDDPVVVSTPTTPSSGGKEKDKEKDMKVDASLQDLTLSVGRLTRSKSRKEEQLLMQLCGGETPETPKPEEKEKAVAETKKGTKGAARTTTPVAQLRQLRARSDGQGQGQAEKEKEKEKEKDKEEDKKVVRGSQVTVNSTAHANGDVQVVKEKVIVAANRGVASYPRLLRIPDGHDQKDGRKNDEASPRTTSGGAGNSSIGSGTGSGSKPQTIIVTETRSLAKVINDAVRKEGSGQSDGKPTLVIIETKSGNTSGPLSSGHHGQSQAHHSHHVPPKSTSVTPTGFTPGASLLANSEAARRATSVTMHPMTRPSISSLYASSTPPAIQMRPSMSSATYSSAAQAMARQASPSPHLISLPPATFPLPEQPRPPFLPKEEEVEEEKGATTDGEKKAKDSGSAKKAAQDNGEISIDVPSLVVPYLIEYPAREKLAEYIRKLKKEEEDANAAEGRSRRTKGGKRRKRKGTGSEDDDYEEDDDEDYEADEDEEDEEDDLDDEDWGGKTAKKVAPAVPSPEPLLSPKPKVGYFDSTLGKFFTDIGLNLVQEWVQVELLRSQKRKLDKGWKSADRERMVKSLTRSLEDYKRKNSPFQFKSKRCPMQACTFKTESRTVLEHHMEALHLHDGRFRCAYCPLDTQEPTEILRHLYERHRVYGRLEKRLLNHTCCLCPFEDASKARLTRHSWKCQKTFDAEKNLAPPPDFEPPAKRVRLVAPIAAITAAAAASTLTAASGGRTGGVAVPAQGYADNRRTGSWSGNSGFPAPPPLRHKGLDAKTLAALGYRSPNTQQMLSSASLKGALMSAGIGSMARPQTSSAAAVQSQSSAPIIVNSSYQIQQGQLYQVLNAAAGGMVPVVGRPYGQLGNPGFTILPAAHSSVPARGGPTPVALIPNVARSLITSSASGASGTRTSSCITSRASTSSGLGRPPTSAYSNVRSSSMQALHTKPNISITPVTRSNNVTQSSSVTLTKASSTTLTLSSRTLTGSQSGGQQKSSPASATTSNQSPGKFVMCEICDGYIKDLDQLRNHMQWIHKVKIHPKMIHNRPPLNCQKCQSRFFTDQGLERHLLGSHGLVTSSMQDSANKGKDGGRCTVCGRVFVWKLLVHMAKDHKMILKPAHLSYKCTVCSATFTMYRLFENHVYEAHSTVAKKVLDKPEAPKSSTASPASATVPGTASPAASSSSLSSPQGKHWCTACKVRFNPVPCVHSWKKVCAFRSCRTDRCEKCRALVLGKKPAAGGAGARKQLGEEDDDEDEDEDEEEVEDEDSDDKEYVGRVKPTSDGAGRELRSVRSNSKCETDSGSSASQEGKVSSSAPVVSTAAVTTVPDEVVEVKQELQKVKVEVVVEKDGGDDDAPFDMEVEAHEHSEPEEIHTDVEED